MWKQKSQLHTIGILPELLKGRAGRGDGHCKTFLAIEEIMHILDLKHQYTQGMKFCINMFTDRVLLLKLKSEVSTSGSTSCALIRIGALLEAGALAKEGIL